MMFGFLLLILFVVILGVGVIAGLAWLNKNNRQGNPLSVNQLFEKREQIPSPDAKRFCSRGGRVFKMIGHIVRSVALRRSRNLIREYL